MDDKDIDDASSIGSRIVRYGKVSGGMAGLAAKLVGDKYFGIKIDREEHSQALMQAMGNLKGPLMKVGQILATIPEALPPEYAQALQQLQSNAPSMGWNFVRRRMKTELGAGWQGQFASFDREAAAAASLGQVHRAVSHDGVDLACKLQYPDMQSAIDADLKQLRIMFGVYGQYDKSIKTGHIYDELCERLHEELDYEREARHTALYADMLGGEGGVHVPTVRSELSTDRLLTTNWLEGSPIMQYKDADQSVRNELAMNMFRAWYVPLYYYGVIHGDPHLGNYTVRDDLGINLLDFGCVRVFPSAFVGGVIDLYHALQRKDEALAVHAFETWGFTDLSKEQIETLSIWAEFLYGPILEDKVRAIGHADGAVYGRETAEKVHKKLRELSKERGGVAVPREFVFMDRAALGLGSVFIHLNAEVNWYRVFNEMIDGFDTAKLAARQEKALARHGLLDSAPTT
ncbi:MAG: ABC1 kinase family protein [Alphaproteobacteria bacterium]